jgi:hypothetical protein
MRLLKEIAFALCLTVPALSQATNNWSSCQTVAAIDNELADDTGLVVYLTPGISGCGTSPYSNVLFVEGQQGVSSSNISAYLAVLLAAQISGQQVSIYYTSTCYGIELSIGGNATAGYCTAAADGAPSMPARSEYLV